MFAKNNKYQKALESVSVLLNMPEDGEAAINHVFDEINSVFGNEKAYILFLNPDGMSLKYSYGVDNFSSKYIAKNISMTSDIEKLIEEKKSFIKNSSQENSFIKFLDSSQKESSFVVSPLRIRNSVYGILVIEKKGIKEFSNDDLAVADSFSSVASYIIKDAELSDVFKMQLKILQENISQRAQAQKVIEEQNRQIVESGRIKDEFLANISHELRTPLTAIIGFSDALREEIFGELNEKQMDYVREINSGAVHLLGLLNGILDMSKIESNQMPLSLIHFDVQPAVDEVVNVVRTLAEKKNIAIEKDYPEKNINLYADFKKFQQIVYNLLSNAIKYNNKNGKIKISFSSDGEKLTFRVKDTGIGIDEKYFDKIFEKFQQVENIYTKTESSTGLGLTITKEFVEMHHGKIWLESKLDEGTVFIFEIPLK